MKRWVMLVVFAIAASVVWAGPYEVAKDKAGAVWAAGDIPTAIKEYEKMLEDFPAKGKKAETHLSLTALKYGQKDYAGVVAHAELADIPEATADIRSVSYEFRSYVAHLQGRVADEAAWCKRAADLADTVSTEERKQAVVHNYAASLIYHVNDYAAGLEQLQRLVAYDKLDASLYINQVLPHLYHVLTQSGDSTKFNAVIPGFCGKHRIETVTPAVESLVKMVDGAKLGDDAYTAFLKDVRRCIKGSEENVPLLTIIKTELNKMKD